MASSAIKKHLHFIGILTKFQQLTMETLFGRFPHLVEDIFGLLNGKTLSCCRQINKTWKENLGIYRLHLVKKIQKQQLKNQNIAYSPDETFEKEEGQNSPAFKHPLRPFLEYVTRNDSFLSRTMGIPTTLEMNITVEQLPLPFLVQCLRYFCGCKLNNCEVNFRIFCIQETLFLGMFIRKGNLYGEDHLVLFRNYHGNLEMPSFLQCVYVYISRYGLIKWLKWGTSFESKSEGLMIFVANFRQSSGFQTKHTVSY